MGMKKVDEHFLGLCVQLICSFKTSLQNEFSCFDLLVMLGEHDQSSGPAFRPVKAALIHHTYFFLF